MEIKYTFNPEMAPAKLNNQQKQLVSALGALGECEKKDILEALKGDALTTKQDKWLIFKYYQPGFIESGFVSLVKTNKIKEEKPKKAGKEVKTIMVEVEGDAFPERVETVEELASQGF